MKSFHFLLISFFGVISVSSDAVTNKYAVGSDVSIAAIRRLQDTCIFNNDLLFMKRLAFHESNDGNNLINQWNNDIGKGGIWQTPISALNQIQSSQTLSANETRQALWTLMNVNIEGLNREKGDLEIPLNAIAASRMFISFFENLGNNIPVDLTKQAQYWVQYYKTPKDNRTAQDFIKNSNKMQKCKPPGMDLIFVIDSSSSIGAIQYANNRKFIQSIIQGLNSNQENRVGIITFSTHAVIRLNLTNNLNKAINVSKTLIYDAGSTSIVSGLNATFNMFNRYGRIEVPLVAILITDGDENQGGNPQIASEQLKSLFVNLFTVGVGHASATNLTYWSSVPNCMFHYTLDNYQQLGAAFPELLNAQICEVSAVAPDNQTSLQGTVDEFQSLFYQISANSNTGLTLRLNVDNGMAAIYASLTSRLPSISDYQFSAIASMDKIGQFYITPKELAGFVPGNNITVYTAIVGITNSTDFVLHYEDGNVLLTSSPPTTTTTSPKTPPAKSDSDSAVISLTLILFLSIYCFFVIV